MEKIGSPSFRQSPPAPRTLVHTKARHALRSQPRHHRPYPAYFISISHPPPHTPVPACRLQSRLPTYLLARNPAPPRSTLIRSPGTKPQRYNPRSTLFQSPPATARNTNCLPRTRRTGPFQKSLKRLQLLRAIRTRVAQCRYSPRSLYAFGVAMSAFTHATDDRGAADANDTRTHMKRSAGKLSEAQNPAQCSRGRQACTQAGSPASSESRCVSAETNIEHDLMRGLD